VVVGSDFVETQGNLLKEIGGKIGQQLLPDMAYGKPLWPTLDVLVNVFSDGW
jgi:hypothetical protein